MHMFESVGSCRLPPLPPAQHPDRSDPYRPLSEAGRAAALQNPPTGRFQCSGRSLLLSALASFPAFLFLLFEFKRPLSLLLSASGVRGASSASSWQVDLHRLQDEWLGRRAAARTGVVKNMANWRPMSTADFDGHTEAGAAPIEIEALFPVAQKWSGTRARPYPDPCVDLPYLIVSTAAEALGRCC